MAEPNTMNPYPYVVNNPLKYVDPLGMMPTVDGDSVYNPYNNHIINRKTGEVTELADWTGCEGTGNDGLMNVSQEYIDFLKQYETFESEAYRGQDSQNQTIGYGHVILPGEEFGTLTEKEAEELLIKDLQSRVDYLNEQMEKYNLDLEQHQFDGLVDMVFNKGYILTPKKATFFKLIVEGTSDKDEIFYQFSRWNKVNGEFSLGVYRRSCDAADIFLDREYGRDYRETPVVIP